MNRLHHARRIIHWMTQQRSTPVATWNVILALADAGHPMSPEEVGEAVGSGSTRITLSQLETKKLVTHEIINGEKCFSLTQEGAQEAFKIALGADMPEKASNRVEIDMERVKAFVGNTRIA